MPVDPDPHPEGNVTLAEEYAETRDGYGGMLLRARVFPHAGAAPEGATLYRSHFASCPSSPEWRR